MNNLINEDKKIELSQKEQIMEAIALGMCFMILFASAIKVIFL